MALTDDPFVRLFLGFLEGLTLLAVALPLLAALVAYVFAHDQGRDPWLWAVVAFVFPPAALLVAALHFLGAEAA